MHGGRVWRPTFKPLKYRGAKKFKNSDFAQTRRELLEGLNKYKYNTRYWLASRQRQIKSYLIHKLYQVNGTFYHLHKRVKFTKFREHYGINDTNRCVGYTPDYIGPTVSKQVKAKNYFIEFVNNNIDIIKNKVSKECWKQLLQSSNEERVVYSAGFTSCCQHLKEYLKDNTTSDTWTVKNILKVLNYSNYKWFKSPVTDFYDGQEIFTSVKTNPDAYSGHYTSMLFGKEKYKSDFAARRIAFNMWTTMKTHVVKNYYLWKILGREKDIKIWHNKEGEVGTRVVMTCEHPITVILCWFAQKMSYIICNDTLWNCKFNITGEFNSVKYSKLIDRSYGYDFELEADWSYYDSNIDTNFLVCAGLLICHGMPNDQLHRNIRYLIISSIVTKFVAIPPGVVVQLNRAQPSGHPFGTLVNCYVNMIYWSLIGYKIYGENYAEYMDIEVYGDDTRAFFKYHKNLVNIDQYVKECGLKSEPLINNFRSIGENCVESEQIDFLKRRYSYTDFIWNHKKMFDKMFYQSKNRDINEQYLMVSSWSESVPTDNDALIIRQLFGEYINGKYSSLLNSDIARKIVDDDNSKLFTRAVNNFQFASYANNRNIYFNKYNAIYAQTIKYKDASSINTDDNFSFYSNNTTILGLMGLQPNNQDLKILFDKLVIGRSPPNIDYKVDMNEVFEEFTKNKIKETNQMISKGVKRVRYFYNMTS